MPRQLSGSLVCLPTKKIGLNRTQRTTCPYTVLLNSIAGGMETADAELLLGF